MKKLDILVGVNYVDTRNGKKDVLRKILSDAVIFDSGMVILIDELNTYFEIVVHGD